ncbi:lipid A biosynthesis acyltransferase [Oleiphilus sp. HI0081]|jgi:KDO2-lipid IV(A) lauroyltransferase|nr:lipid A biosynthesis acyltransferase [Oleiphilus sp. HI0043]KZY41787.1 lipid A biosynthesis acyltransferase [Oleiphilus sp. HI0050]KZY63932.1 lipid A biosynthesis acyltransferase [Oleiphilus sp. HI0061]KZY75885.1 lipid A biosynthesis acyltransferase [Oleiphilus sp. HI0068]KZY77369.1 lipid A biosynthesis acyltransferase [Oleiphilus sp. HI0069]KZY87794.1 lipid A biosynthesis acyltransferase [Oleiphilus sp. HI0072]KZZ16589.1 lipid A biosynthesis acyltransferase [Oleiphilus sp. HI0078]KZZ2873
MNKKHQYAESLGRFVYRRMKNRGKVTRQNIELCFPELSSDKQNEIIEGSFISTAEGLIEMLQLWWRDVTPYLDTMTVIGKEHLLDAQNRGTGVLLIGGHFGVIDMTLPLVGTQLKRPGYMYRPNNDPVIDWMIESGRNRNFDIQSFSKYQLKEMLEFIKGGGEVWYAPDQDFGKRCDLFVPFFGVSTGCISTPSWIARETGATVLHVAPFRLPNGQYEVIFSPVFEGFGEDPQKDAQLWNQALEAAIKRHPEQYLWQHKRFKTRPDGEGPVYQ